MEAEHILGGILAPILRVEGFEIAAISGARHEGLEFVGVRGDPALGSSERLGGNQQKHLNSVSTKPAAGHF